MMKPARDPVDPTQTALQGTLALAACFAIVSWASAYPITRIALHEMPAIPLAAARYGLAAVVAILWLLARRAPLPDRRDWPRFLCCGAIGISLYNIFFNTGEQTVPSGTAALIIATAPLLATVIAVVLMGERLTLWGWLGSALSFAGVAALVVGEGHGVSLKAGDAGPLLIFGCALCGAIYTTAQRRLVQRYGALNAIAWILIIGAAIFIPWWPDMARGVARASWSTRSAIAELGLFPAALGYAAWGYVIGRRGAARTAVLLYLLPPVTIALAFLLAGEVPSMLTLAGGVVVMAGVVITNVFGHVPPGKAHGPREK